MAALRKLEIDIPAVQGASSRPFLRSLEPSLDGLALLVAVGVSGGDPVFIVSAVLTFLLLNVDTSRVYRLDPRVGQEVGWLLVRVASPLLVVVSLESLGVLPWLGSTPNLDRLVVAAGIGAIAVAIGRMIAYGVARAAKARGLVSERTLVVGCGPLGIELAQVFDRYPEYGLCPIGFIDGPTASELPHPLLGGPHDLGRVVRDLDVRRLVIAFGHGKDRDTATILRELEGLPIEVHIVPRFFELSSVPQGAADNLRGVPLVHLRRPASRLFARVSKRIFDVAVGSVLLALFAPLLLVAAVAVRLSSPGPVLFRQLRVGRRGEPFQMLKFRTMRVESDPQPSWTIEEHRVTRVGRVLRRASIDELPQLINVLRGDMSLVGPRPELPHFVERFSESVPSYAHRLRVQGGMTGLAQVHGRSRDLDSIPERVRLDNTYIESLSLWGDILIIARTIQVLFRGDRG